MPKCRLSKVSAGSRKPPHRNRSAMLVERPGSDCRRSVGASPTARQPVAAMRHACDTALKPPGSDRLVPARNVPLLAREVTVAGEGAREATGAVKRATSSRAVGWSKIKVIGSWTAPPAACCSPLRSSTAPSESSPASIKGASTSTERPTARFTSDITSSMLKTGAASNEAAMGSWRGANAESNGGTTPPPPSIRRQLIGTTATTAGTPAATAQTSAAKPCARPISPKPAAVSRAFTPPPAAIPTSAHGPHCTLVAASPASRRPLASASRQLLAAA
eukprot:scaffold80720_cov71-Phaeocystis_antarctica.AAC.18